MMALDHIVRSGKALYVGISSYDAQRTQQAVAILRRLGTPCLIHQPVYNLFNRWIEGDVLRVLASEGIGCIAFSPLAQGLLTDRYLHGLPTDARATKPHGFLKAHQITEEKLAKVRALNNLASQRGQSLAQMALAWVLRHDTMTAALIGASRAEQIENCCGALRNLSFTSEELALIDRIVA